jgi:hypothetical protein
LIFIKFIKEIRPNGHVTREEWAHLQALAKQDEFPSTTDLSAVESLTTEQREFHEQLARAARQVRFSNISPKYTPPFFS